jgi:hypothetical protein
MLESPLHVVTILEISPRLHRIKSRSAWSSRSIAPCCPLARLWIRIEQCWQFAELINSPVWQGDRKRNIVCAYRGLRRHYKLQVKAIENQNCKHRNEQHVHRRRLMYRSGYQAPRLLLLSLQPTPAQFGADRLPSCPRSSNFGERCRVFLHRELPRGPQPQQPRKLSVLPCCRSRLHLHHGACFSNSNAAAHASRADGGEFSDNAIRRSRTSTSSPPTTTKLRCTGQEQLAQPSPCHYYLFDLKIPYEHSKLRHMTPRPPRMGQH